jgi:hypothetical protein
MADTPMHSHADNVNPKKLSPSHKPQPLFAPSLHKVADSNQNKPAFAPSRDEVAKKAYSIYVNEGSQPGHEVKHWLMAEAQLLGGVERQSQMHPGSSLFKTEH